MEWNNITIITQKNKYQKLLTGQSPEERSTE